MHPVLLSAVLLLLLSLGACSSNIPREIRQPFEGAPGIGEVRERPEAFRSQKVRWGGVILAIENRADTSSMTIVAFPLDSDGKPKVSDQSTGRFIARVDDFLEPTVYGADREITVIGELQGTETREVGEYAYEYPIVRAQHYHLWPEEKESDALDYPPYWYDPWYPYYPWYYPHYPRYYH